MEARRTAGLNNAPSCTWSSSPPVELKKVPPEALSANAGFVSFGNINDVGLRTFLFVILLVSLTYGIMLMQYSDFPAPCRRQKARPHSLEFVNFPCIC